MKKALNNINDVILKIREGHEHIKNELIQQYMPFIISTISKTTNRYVDVNNSDELSIGLLAFNEAIDKYEINKGSFISFAEIVIRSRIYDYLKKEKKNREMITDDSSIEEPSILEEDFKSVEIKEEIKMFKEALKVYGLTFKKLAENSPSHSDTKNNAKRIAQLVFNNPILISELEKKKKLPIKATAKYCDVSEKIVKTSKVYITAYIILLKVGGSLVDYLDVKGGVSNE